VLDQLHDSFSKQVSTADIHIFPICSFHYQFCNAQLVTASLYTHTHTHTHPKTKAQILLTQLNAQS